MSNNKALNTTTTADSNTSTAADSNISTAADSNISTAADSNTSTAKWQELLEEFRWKIIPSGWKSANEKNSFLQAVQNVIVQENEMHFEEGTLTPYIAHGSHGAVKGQGIPNHGNTDDVKIPEKHGDINSVIESLLAQLFHGMHNPHHPFTLINVIPPPSIASLVGVLLSTKLNPNAVHGFSAVNVTRGELETASMIIHLLHLGSGENQWPKPWSPDSPGKQHVSVSALPTSGEGSGGITTFGGTGCYLYAIKLALTKVANSAMANNGDTIRAVGFERGRFVVLVSGQGHYCSSNVTDWLGIGHGQVIKVRTTPDNTMDLNDLKMKLDASKQSGKVVIAIVCTFGTTDANALDDVAGARKVLQNFSNIKDAATGKQYDKPLLYADSVIGWIWLYFVHYDFVNNPLGFDDSVLLDMMKTCAKLAEGLGAVDAFGTDFHKSGFSPYPSSMVMVKNYGELVQLFKRESSPYLQQEQYDPGLYTLETSRSTMGYVGTWATYHHLGLNGMRTLMYGVLRLTHKLRQKLRDTGFIIVCNKSNHFYSTLLRIYPYDYTQEQYEEELTDESQYTRFMHGNEFQRVIYDRLLQNVRTNDGSAELLSTPNISMTTGFRNTYYNLDGNKQDSDGHPMQGVFALKCYINIAFMEEAHLDVIVQHFIRVRQEVMKDLMKIASEGSFKGSDSLVLPKLPEGVHRHNHLLPALYIPYRFMFMKKVENPDFTLMIKQSRRKAKESKETIRKLQEQLILVNRHEKK